MTVVFRCPSCSKVYRVEDRLAGREVACKTCQARMVIPEAMATPASPPPVPPTHPEVKSDLFDDLEGLAQAEASPSSELSEPSAVLSGRLRSQGAAPKPESSNSVWMIAGGLGGFGILLIVAVFALTRDGSSSEQGINPGRDSEVASNIPSDQPGRSNGIINPAFTGSSESKASDRSGPDRTQDRAGGRSQLVSGSPSGSSGSSLIGSDRNRSDRGIFQAGRETTRVSSRDDRASFFASSSPSLRGSRWTQPFARGSEREIRERAKGATVYITAMLSESEGSQGTGFVIRGEGETAIIATNRHVVYPHAEVERGISLDSVEPAEITVFFQSGENDQAAYPAEILIADPSDERDLALLRVTGVSSIPEPIDVFSAPPGGPEETMPVTLYGYPLGNSLAMRRNFAAPRITVSQGKISSFRNNEYGNLARVQLDVNINPGNSGGPVLDNQGHFIGIAVEKAANYGLVIPPQLLNRILLGRVETLEVTNLNEPGESPESFLVRLYIIDPFQKVRSTSLLYAPATPGELPPSRHGEDGTYPAIAHSGRIAIDYQAEDHAGAGIGKFYNVTSDRRYVVQAEMTDGAGQLVRSRPMIVTLPRPDDEILTLSAQPKERRRIVSLTDLPLANDRLQPLVLANGGDPLKSDIELEKDNSSITLTLPGNKPFMLSAQQQYRLINAPLMLSDPIDDDFLAMVKVKGALNPGNQVIRYRGRNLPIAYCAAGLVLWHDDENFVRIQRGGIAKPGSLQRDSILLIEAVENGREAGYDYYTIENGIETEPMIFAFYFENQFRFGYSPDGGERFLFFDGLTINVPMPLQVGISAQNASRRSISATFEDFVIATKEEVETIVKEGILQDSEGAQQGGDRNSRSRR